MLEIFIWAFFQNLMKNAVETRIKSKINQADYLDYFVNLMQKKEISLDSLAGHGATFLTDGYETSSIGISSALYEPAKNKNIQNKLRDAIQNAMPNDEDFTYDNIMELEYLDQVWNESLRLHSPLLYLPKKCNEAVEVDMLDGKKYSFNEGDVIYFPVVSVHLDEEYYDDPLSFIPERFDEDKGGVKFYKDKGVFLPFGDGPRICVGMRFAIAQSKMALATLVRNFEITVNKKTGDTFEIHPMAILLMNIQPYWLNFKRIST
jgi:cytochrome P450 family 6/cytochrome P450 family 28